MSDLRIMDQNWLWESGVEISISGSATINPNFPLTNLQSYLRSKVIRTDNATDTLRVVIDLGSTGPVDSLSIVFPINQAIKLSPSATITLKASATTHWTSPAVSQSLSVDANYGVISHFFSATQNYRYWCIEISDALNPYGYIELGKIFLSKATQLTQSPEIGFSYNLTDLNKSIKTDYGHRYTDVYPSLRGFAFNYTVISSEDLETLYLLADRNGSSKPVVLALDTQAALWDKDRFQIYGYMKEFSAAQKLYTYFDCGVAVEETA